MLFSVERAVRAPEGLHASERESKGLNWGKGEREQLVFEEGEGLDALRRRQVVDQPSQQLLRAHDSSLSATSDIAC